MKHCVFLDIDGTLIAFGQEDMSEATKNDLLSAQAKGVKCLINTGRPRASLPKAVTNFPFDGYCCACGGYISVDGNVIVNEPLGIDNVRYLEHIALTCNAHIIFEGIETNYCYDGDLKLHEHHAKVSQAFRDCTTFGPLPMDESIAKQILKVTVIDFDHSQLWVKEAQQRFNFMMHLSYSGDHFSGEIVPKTSSKAKAMDKVKAYYHEDVQSIAIGDGINDIEMLQEADVSFWMANGDSSVQQYATHTTDTVLDNGVGNALRKLNLID